MSQIRRGGRLSRLDPAELPGARPAPLPRAFTPQLATLSAVAPRGERWIHELKFDGYRMLAVIRDGKCRLITRRGNDWTVRFRSVAEAVESLPIESAILDGEVVSLDEHGVSNFQQLQNQLKRGDLAELAYYLFDIPYFEGYDLTGVRQVERKEFLESVLSGHASEQATLRYSDHIHGEGAEVHKQACRQRLEGIVSKRIDSKYVQSRSGDWLKTKCTKRQEFVIGGFSQPSGSRSFFGALLLGYHDREGRLIYAGRVGTGFTTQSLHDVHRELKKHKTAKPPFANPPRGAEARGVTWVEPKLVCEVEFTEWTGDGQLRHPSFQGLREDKPPKSIIREEEVNVRQSQKK